MVASSSSLAFSLAFSTAGESFSVTVDTGESFSVTLETSSSEWGITPVQNATASATITMSVIARFMQPILQGSASLNRNPQVVRRTVNWGLFGEHRPFLHGFTYNDSEIRELMP